MTTPGRGSTPMRILFLCEGDAETRDSWSGVSRSVVEHLRAAGHTVLPGDVDLYGFSRGLVAARTAAWPRRRWWVRYHLGERAFRARSAVAARRVRNLGVGADVILQVGATFRIPAAIDLPVAMYCDSNIELSRAGALGRSEASVLNAAEIASIRAREEEVYRRAAVIFTMSHRLRHSFIEDFAIPPDRLVTVHCGPNTPPDAGAEPSGNEEYPPTILFMGRDFERKGGDLLLRAFEEVRRRVPDARLRMVGSKPRRGAVDGVEFLGFQSRDTAAGREAMERAYRTATVFCMPTRFDPFGTSFVEAMVYRLPCVGPDLWAVPEIIENGTTGYIVPPEDPAALAEALVRLLTDRELARRMGRAARARALEHFAWPVLVGRMIESMEALVDRGRRPGAATA